jgi:hypothetical protein
MHEIPSSVCVGDHLPNAFEFIVGQNMVMLYAHCFLIFAVACLKDYISGNNIKKLK